MRGVKIGDYHTYDDWELMLKEYPVASPPEVQKHLVEIMGRDGFIDLSTALDGIIHYKPRKLKLQFTYIGERSGWANIYSDIQNAIHGDSVKIILDDDPAFFYTGLVEMSSPKYSETTIDFTIDCTVDPFKYDIISTAEDWEWNPFDFETGYIQGGSDIEVKGEEVVYIYGRTKQTYPSIRCTAPMTVLFLGATYQLQAGNNVCYDMIMKKGENKLLFKGNGNVTVNYRGGLL